MKTTTSLLLLTFLSACGSDGIADGDDLGEGTGTLVVSATVSAENLLSNASDPNDFRTDVEVSVTRAGQAVTDAIVIVTSDTGAIDLVAEGEPGRYRAAQTGYAQRYVLDVSAGSDELVGARVDGPGLHVFTSPTPGAQVQGGLPVDVTWDRDDEAEAAGIETQEMDKLDIADTGEFTIPADQLKHDQGEVKDERIRVWRENRISPAGGAAGSSFRVTVRNEIEILVLP